MTCRTWALLAYLMVTLSCGLGNLGAAVIQWRSSDPWVIVHLLLAVATLIACLVLARQLFHAPNSINSTNSMNSTNSTNSSHRRINQ